MDTGIERRVIEFVAAQAGVSAETLSVNTTLFGDLGVDGNDGWDLMQAFGETFGVDLSEFDFSRHFGPEAPAFPPLFFVQLFREAVLGHDPHKVGGVVPITIGDLIEAAEEKRWAG